MGSNVYFLLPYYMDDKQSPPACTPAPWLIVFRNPEQPSGISVDDGSEYVAQFVVDTCSPADARLIAYAPNLLETLEQVFDYADTGKGCDIVDNESLYAVVKQAIAKARGE